MEEKRLKELAEVCQKAFPGVVLAPLRTPTLPPATTTNCYVVGHERLWVVDPGSPHPPLGPVYVAKLLKATVAQLRGAAGSGG